MQNDKQAREHVFSVRVTFDTVDEVNRAARAANKPISQYLNDRITELVRG